MDLSVTTDRSYPFKQIQCLYNVKDLYMSQIIFDSTVECFQESIRPERIGHQNISSWFPIGSVVSSTTQHVRRDLKSVLLDPIDLKVIPFHSTGFKTKYKYC